MPLPNFMCAADKHGFEACVRQFDAAADDLAVCNVNRATGIAVDLIVATAVLYFVLTYILPLSKL